MKIVIVALVVAVIAAAGGGYFGYTTAYNTALAAGTTAGQEKGYQSGFTAGQDAGNKAGYTKGKEDGLVAGQAEGYSSGIATAQGTVFKLHDPTFSEVKAFLKADTTNNIPYNEVTFVCTHYARNVINNAVKLGIRTAYVEVRHPTISHSLIAFETTDKGMIYFDPQYDNQVLPVLGQKYWKCMQPTDNGTSFSAPNLDDTINDILIIW